MTRMNDDETDRLVEEGKRSYRAAQEIAADLYPNADRQTLRYVQEHEGGPDGSYSSAVEISFNEDLNEDVLEERAHELRERLTDDNRILHAEVFVETTQPELTIEVADFKDPR